MFRAHCIVLLGLLPLKMAFAQSMDCAEVLFLIEQSAEEFHAIQADTRSEHGGFTTTHELADAQYCVILEDPEKRSYLCTWSYPIGSDLAKAAFDATSSQMGHCLADLATVVQDQPVNHPDTYNSLLFKLAETEVRVTHKNKGVLNSTLVSVIVEGATRAK